MFIYRSSSVQQKRKLYKSRSFSPAVKPDMVNFTTARCPSPNASQSQSYMEVQTAAAHRELWRKGRAGPPVQDGPKLFGFESFACETVLPEIRSCVQFNHQGLHTKEEWSSGAGNRSKKATVRDPSVD